MNQTLFLALTHGFEKCFLKKVDDKGVIIVAIIKPQHLWQSDLIKGHELTK